MTFSRILIANRGEIAVRIAQTCREMGIESVAVYSDVDRSALHVRVADSAYPIGPAPARDSYLNVAAVIQAALLSGADAVHPGYGFLAENSEFAAAVQAAGLGWIGPPPAAIALLGDKVAAKRLAQDAGVPVVPGYDGTDSSAERLMEEAERIGLPVILKAAAGGGGKGMRVVDSPAELALGVEAARREAASAFGDERIFLEKLLLRPRHIEMQILADTMGGIVYLGERDCSTQRRHQKVIEEAPATISEQLRVRMGEAAVRVARASGYANAGTVEFLVADESFYFLEVNTRIQVEHPVTEATAGVDLVRLQIELAAGQPLPFTQSAISTRGHAIEARLYAEDPNHQFLPSSGRVDTFAPPQGPGIRNDIGVQSGDSVTAYYDPMIAKLIVHAETRPLAVARLQHALSQFVCVGPTTNLHFLQWIAGRAEFHDSMIDIGFVERVWRGDERHEPPRDVFIAAALADLVWPERSDDPWTQSSAWRHAGLARPFRFACNGVSSELTVTASADSAWHVSLDGSEIDVSDVEVGPDRVAYRVGDATLRFVTVRRPNGYTVNVRGVAYDVQRSGRSDDRHSVATGGQVAAALSAPMPGTIISIGAEVGQRVDAGEPLVIMEAMKMEHVVEAARGGVVKSILVRPGDMVAAGTVLVQMDE